MATTAATTAGVEPSVSKSVGPLLEPGDRLSRDEFERRYARMPNLKKAELIEGIVYMPSPVRAGKHANLTAIWPGGWRSTSRRLPASDVSTNRPCAWNCTTIRSGT